MNSQINIDLIVHSCLISLYRQYSSLYHGNVRELICWILMEIYLSIWRDISHGMWLWYYTRLTVTEQCSAVQLNTAAALTAIIENMNNVTLRCNAYWGIHMQILILYMTYTVLLLIVMVDLVWLVFSVTSAQIRHIVTGCPGSLGRETGSRDWELKRETMPIHCEPLYSLHTHPKEHKLHATSLIFFRKFNSIQFNLKTSIQFKNYITRQLYITICSTFTILFAGADGDYTANAARNNVFGWRLKLNKKSELRTPTAWQTVPIRNCRTDNVTQIQQPTLVNMTNSLCIYVRVFAMVTKPETTCHVNHM